MDYKGFNIPKDIYIFFIIPFRIILIKNKLKKTGFNKLLLKYKKNCSNLEPDEDFILKLKKYYKASSFFLQKLFRDSNPCISRSILLYEYCSQKKVKSKLITGVYKEKNRLIGHSWLEIKSCPLCEDEERLKIFTIVSEV